MSILDTFYILFKSNADDAVKSTQRYDKATKELEGSLKSATDQSENLGQSFVKLVESGAALAGAYAGFNVIKQATIDQVGYNTQLNNTSKIYNTNVGTLKAYAQAAAQASGVSSDKQGSLFGLTSLLSQNVWAKGDPFAIMLAARARYRSLANSPIAQNEMAYGQHSQYQTPGERLMLTMSQEKFDTLRGSTGVVAAGTLTPEQAQAAADAEAAQEDLSGALGKLETAIATPLIGSINTLTNVLSNFVSSAGNGTATALGLAGTYIAGKALQWGITGGITSRLLGLGARIAPKAGTVGEIATGGLSAAESAATFGGGAAATVGAGVAAAGSAALLGIGEIGYGGYKLYEMWAPYLKSKFQKAPLTKASQAKQSDLDFWKSQGYSTEQAAAIMANIQAESGGNPNKWGSNGENSYGLAQWHPDRAKKIKDGTGIDIYHASREKQMRAIAWEMKGQRKGFDDSKFRSMTDPAEAAAYFSRGYETPADTMTQAAKRGLLAASLATQYANAGGTIVNIDKIEIHTAATNADEIARHIKNAVMGTCSEVQSKADNGRMG